jgi:hypothetical protein
MLHCAMIVTGVDRTNGEFGPPLDRHAQDGLNVIADEEGISARLQNGRVDTCTMARCHGMSVSACPFHCNMQVEVQLCLQHFRCLSGLEGYHTGICAVIECYVARLEQAAGKRVCEGAPSGNWMLGVSKLSFLCSTDPNGCSLTGLGMASAE